MLPAPPSSCAGWWFAQLWRALLRARPDHHAIWLIEYDGEGEARLRPYGGQARGGEQVAGSLVERRLLLDWSWPGEDGMLHILRGHWQPGEVIVRPTEWERLRQPFPPKRARPNATPWPLRVRIHARGWHGQTLDRAELAAADDPRSFPIGWAPPAGEPRLPLTDLPCGLTTLDRPAGDGDPALILAGLTLPWRIDLDYATWAVWRRLSAGDLLRRLGGAQGFCPRHGRACPWPITGRVSQAG